jgi:hypothetical protein
MDITDVVTTGILAVLADRLQERQDLNVTDGAAHLGNHHIHIVGGQTSDPPFDLVGDMGNHLHRLAKIVAAPLRSENRLINRTGRRIGVPGQIFVDETLVMAEIKVCLATVIGDEHLTVLKGVHGPWIHVDVGIELLESDS